MSDALSLRAPLLLAAVCLCGGAALVGCDDPEGTCSSDNDCGVGLLCGADTCVPVCFGNQSDGTSGSPCNVNADCNSGSCDNLARGASCECVGGGGGAGGMGGSGGAAGGGGSTACGPAAGTTLTMVLDWSAHGSGNLDVGATTPNDPTDVIAANYDAPDADPTCTHSGDAPNPTDMTVETMICSPPSAGTYNIVVDSSESVDVGYELRVTVDGANVPGFPQPGTIGPNGTESVSFCLQ